MNEQLCVNSSPALDEVWKEEWTIMCILCHVKIHKNYSGAATL